MLQGLYPLKLSKKGDVVKELQKLFVQVRHCGCMRRNNLAVCRAHCEHSRHMSTREAQWVLLPRAGLTPGPASGLYRNHAIHIRCGVWQQLLFVQTL